MLQKLCIYFSPTIKWPSSHKCLPVADDLQECEIAGMFHQWTPISAVLDCFLAQAHRAWGTIASKINDTPKGVYLPNSKQHSNLAVAYLLAHNNISQIYYYFITECCIVNCSFSDNLTPLGVTFILLMMI